MHVCVHSRGGAVRDCVLLRKTVQLDDLSIDHSQVHVIMCCISFWPMQYFFIILSQSLTPAWLYTGRHLWAKYLRSVNIACFLCMVKFACRSYNLWELLSSDLMLLTFLSTWTAQRRLARAAEHCIGLFWGHLTPTYNDAVFSLS